MKITLKYGKRGLDVEFGGDITVFRTRDMPLIGPHVCANVLTDR